MPLSPLRWWPFGRGESVPAPAASTRRAAQRAAPAEPARSDPQAARARTRRRLVGAAVLLMLGVAVFGLLFETAPRPADGQQARRDTGAVQLAEEALRAAATQPEAAVAASAPPRGSTVEVQSAEAMPPQAPPGDADAAKPAGATLSASAPSSGTVTGLAPAAPPPAPPPRPAPVPSPSTATATAAAVAPPPPAAADDGARARALLEGRAQAAAPSAGTSSAPSAAGTAASPLAAPVAGRYVVQVGAFGDPAALRDARQRVERLGLKTYTQVVQTPQGERTRVRVGPFATREEAEAAAARLRAARLPAALLTL